MKSDQVSQAQPSVSHVSAPYINTASTVALYTSLLIRIERRLGPHTVKPVLIDHVWALKKWSLNTGGLLVRGPVLYGCLLGLLVEVAQDRWSLNTNGHKTGFTVQPNALEAFAILHLTSSTTTHTHTHTHTHKKKRRRKKADFNYNVVLLNCYHLKISRENRDASFSSQLLLVAMYS